MKKVFFLSFLFVCILCSCSNIFTPKNEVFVNQGLVIINLCEASESFTNSRTVGPANSNTFSEVESWDVTFTSEDYESTKTLTASNNSYTLPDGTYDVKISGTVPNSTLSFEGEAKNVTVSHSKAASVTINVSKKKKETGNLEFSVTLGDNILIEDTSSLVVSLTDLLTDKVYSTEKDNLSLLGLQVISGAGAISFASSGDETVTTCPVKSSFYKVDIFYEYSGEKYTLLIQDPYIEICDGCTTVFNVEANGYELTRTYYATTAEASGNGLTEAYPINLQALLSKLSSMNDWNNINIVISELEDLSAIDFTDYVVTGKKLNVSLGSIQFFENNDYTSSFTANQSTSISDIAEMLEMLDYSNYPITISVDGVVTETKQAVFKNVRSVTISGASGNTPNTAGGIGDVLDYSEAETSKGIFFQKQNDSGFEFVNISNVKITGIAGNSTDRCSGIRVYTGDSGKYMNTISISSCDFDGISGSSLAQCLLIENDGSSSSVTIVSIDGCSFKNCGSSGGVIRVESGVDSFSVRNCEFSNNSAADIYIGPDESLSNTEILLLNDTFSNNTYGASNSSILEQNANLIYKNGKLTLGIGKENDGMTIYFTKGKTILIGSNINDNTAQSYVLAPVKVNGSGFDYSQTEPVISTGGGSILLADILGRFKFNKDSVSLDSTGCISRQVITISTAAELIALSNQTNPSLADGETALSLESIQAIPTFENTTINLSADLDMSSYTLNEWKAFYSMLENDFTVEDTYETDTAKSNRREEIRLEKRFAGTFDGNGHTIKVSKRDSQSYERAGLVAYNNGIIQNLIVECNSELSSPQGNCHRYGFVTRLNYEDGIIRNCKSTGSVYLKTMMDVSGMADNNYGVIENCINEANLTVERDATWGGFYSGASGMTGCLKDNGIVRNCVNYGTIYAKNVYANSGNMNGRPGAIIVSSDSNTKVENCYWAKDCVQYYYSNGWTENGKGSSASDLIVKDCVGRIRRAMDTTMEDYETGETTTSTVYCPTEVNGKISGCGSFEDTTITAGTVENCGVAQTLSYGTTLLSALNTYAESAAGVEAGLKTWVTGSDGHVTLSF